MYNDEDFPDYLMLCDFRNALVGADLLVYVLDDINSQLEAQDLKIQKGSNVIIDATVVQRVACSLKKPTGEESHTVSTEEGVEREPRKLSKDPDATFHKKGNTCFLGYKGYLATDVEGFGENVFVRPANESLQDRRSEIL